MTITRRSLRKHTLGRWIQHAAFHAKIPSGGRTTLSAVSCGHSVTRRHIAHASNVVMDANHVTLRPASSRVISRVAALRIAPLGARSVHVEQAKVAKMRWHTHPSQGATEYDVDGSRGLTVGWAF